MQLTFLQADRPLIKRYTKKNDGTFKKESYTDAWLFTSITEEVTTLADFHSALVRNAEAGNCLHTGSLAKELREERRKGLHDKDEKRAWIVIDLDELKGFATAEDVIAELPKEFHNVSYIEQHSAGSGLKPGLNMHLFFMMDREEHMADIKTWMMHVNLATKSLSDKLTLTAKDYGLSYPLDRIANDNGRIIYIAPPECVGFQDPIASRVRLVEKTDNLLRFPFASSVVSDVKKLEKDLIKKLRQDKGLTTSKGDFYDRRGEIEVLKRKLTEKGRVHPCQKDNDLVMRCNLDDGDSEAYFYFIKSPALLRNHKGDPALFMEAVDKEYYDKIAMPAAKKEREKDVQPFTFRDKHSDKYYAGLRLAEEIHEQPNVIGAKDRINDYFVQHNGLGVPDPIPTWEMKFDPRLETQWNPDRLVFNTWRKSEIMSSATYRTLPPVTITRVIQHVVGGDAEAYERFINWLAYIYQNRTKTGTAWIFHGVQGTGKGLLIDHILTPMFGHDYVVKQQSRNLKAEFNGWMEKAIIMNLDEFDINDAGGDAVSVMQALKMWITDTRLPIRAMHKESRMTDNFSNFILTTNAKSAIFVDEGDRRISFGVRQEERLAITPEEVDMIASEVLDFAGYLSGYKVDKALAHTCLENDTKNEAKKLSLNSIEEFVNAVHDGDLEYFIDGLHEEVDTNMLSAKEAYRKMVDQWIHDAKHGEESVVDAHDLVKPYKIVCGQKNGTIGKFKKMMQNKSLPDKRLRIGKRRVNGWRIKWNIDNETLVSIGGHLSSVKSAEDIEKALQKEILASPEAQQ